MENLFLLTAESNGLNFHPSKFGCPLLPTLGATALGKGSLLGRARVNCLDVWPMSYSCREHFKELSLYFGPNENILYKKVYSSQVNHNCFVALSYDAPKSKQKL